MAGSLSFCYRSEALLAPAGWVNLAFPGKAHCGRPMDIQGWTCRMFYLDPVHLAAVAGLNPFRLVRGFPQELGMPPHAYLRGFRSPARPSVRT